MSVPGAASPPVDGSVPATLVSVAGFLPDLREGLARHGLGVTLGDEVPFTEYFEAVSRDELLLLVPAAADLLGRELPTPGPSAGAVTGLPPALDAVVLDAASVALLGRLDDTRLRRLWTDWWSRVEAHRGVPPDDRSAPAPDLTQSVRGLVVQARASVANGWVLVVAATRA